MARGEKNRHAGLSQFLLELRTPGIRVQPIVDLVGHPGFNEVFFDDVVVGPDCLLGVEGEVWKQVTSELSLERSGPERYLSSFALFLELVRLAGRVDSEALRHAVGRLTAEVWTLRQMSLSVAGPLAAGEDPMLAAAIVKDLGNTFEQARDRRARHRRHSCCRKDWRQRRAAAATGALSRDGRTWRFSGSLQSVPWGRDVAHVVTSIPFEDHPHVVVLSVADANLHKRTNLAGEPCDDLRFDASPALCNRHQAIGVATAIAHQVHGAIGFTWEYPLRHATQRLWSWRSEYGNDRY